MRNSLIGRIELFVKRSVQCVVKSLTEVEAEVVDLLVALLVDLKATVDSEARNLYTKAAAR